MANYHQIKNAAILTPTTNTDLGSDTNRYSNVFMSGNIVMSNGVTVTSTNVITPKIASVTYPGDDTAADIAGGQTITITGTGFSSGASVLIGGSPVAVVTVVSSTSITFTSPPSSAGNYALYVVNSDGGTAIYIPGVAYSGTPTWSTSSGSLATVYETNSISNTVTATGDATISYSVASGTLPTGSSLNTSTGLISGTAPASAGSTTYTFTIRATDGQNQDTDRSFSITVNTDAVTWSSPVDNTTTALDKDSAMVTFTMSATSAAGKSITYTANALPTGLSISTNTIVGTPTVVGSSSSLITATAADSSRTATRTFNWVVSVASEPYWPYVTLLVNGEGAAATNNAQNATFIDSSTNNYTVTNTNTPTQGTNSPYSQGSWSNYFNTTSESLGLSMGAGQAFGTGDFTVELWLNPLSTTAVNIFMPVTSSASWSVLTYGSQLYWHESGGNLGGAGYGSIPAHQWSHLAISRASSVLKMFINGVQVYSAANTFNYSNNSTVRNIGPNGGGSAPCYISNLRVVKGTALYTANFTPSTTPLTAITNTTLLTCQSNRFIDISTTNATITINGNVVVQKFSPFLGTAAYTPATHGGSVYLKGANATTGDYLTTTISPLGTDDFTIECWTYLEATGFINGGAVFALFDTGTPQMILRPENNVFWRLFYKSTSFTIDQSTSPIVTGRWIHHAVVRISGTTRYYQDGILIGSGADVLNYTGTTLKVGSYADYNMKGFISDFRIVAGTGVYTGSFTPPTQALTAISGTRVLLRFTNAGVIDQTGMNDLSIFGDAKISTAVKKYNSGSISFDGTGDYLTTPNNNRLQFGTGQFTVEFWMNTADTSANIIGLTGSAAAGYWNIMISGGSIYWQTAYATTNSVSYSISSYTNTWTHYAFVRTAANNLKLYINGTEQATASDTTNYNGTAGNLVIGYSVDYDPLVGYIDDLRITKGVARYTSTFTAPTTALNTR